MSDVARRKGQVFPIPLRSELTHALSTPGLHHRLHLRGFRDLYRLHHARRFQWLREKIAVLGKTNLSVIEIGCAEAKSLDYMPVAVRRYLGFDAGWRSGWSDGKPFGIEAARHRYMNHANFEFCKSVHCYDVEIVNEQFDVGIALETLEYLETAQLESYIRALAGKLNETGCFFSTMPNEQGIPLLVKAAGAKLSGVRRSQYTAAQFLNAVLGRVDRVPRAERGRKGFDYRRVIDLMQRHFRFVLVEAVGFVKLPPSLSLNIGVTASHSTIHKGIVTSRP